MRDGRSLHHAHSAGCAWLSCACSPQRSSYGTSPPSHFRRTSYVRAVGKEDDILVRYRGQQEMPCSRF